MFKLLKKLIFKELISHFIQYYEEASCITLTMTELVIFIVILKKYAGYNEFHSLCKKNSWNGYLCNNVKFHSYKIGLPFSGT